MAWVALGIVFVAFIGLAGLIFLVSLKVSADMGVLFTFDDDEDDTCPTFPTACRCHREPGHLRCRGD